VSITEVVVGPAAEPVTLAEAKLHCRVDISTDDSLISGLITEAREWAERYTRRALVTQTWRVWFDDFPEVEDYCPPGSTSPLASLWLPGGKVASISSVQYTAPDGTLTTLAAPNYTLDSKGHDRQARLVPAYGLSWPSTRDVPNAVQVEYVVGYGNAAAVPPVIRQAILLHAGWGYEHREATDKVPFIESLELKLADFRLFEFA
jgi:uncharacterized phiE125 gp8 family phage protein